jgi:cell division protease FtsH
VNQRRQSYLIYSLLMMAILAFVFLNFNQASQETRNIGLNRVAADIEAGLVSRVILDDYNIKVIYRDGEEKTSVMDARSSLPSQLADFGVSPDKFQAEGLSIEVKPESALVLFWNAVSLFLPFVIMGLFFWFMMRQAQSSNSQAMSFSKSRARMMTGEHPTVTFADVAGADEAKEELSEVVEFLKEPQKFVALGARIPKGVLLVGAPGTGKTLLAKAVSGEAGVPFFSISGSEFVEMFVGVGASRVRDLFEQAKKHSPCIIFVDEIDAVGRHRGAGLGGSHDEREQTLNQLLVEMDGFDTDTNVIVIAATNRPDILDPALLRPGRFDRRVMLDKPDMRGREAILKVHARGKPISSSVSLETIARATPGFAGADLENLLNEAAILAARRNKRVIEPPEFEEAIERVIAGPERKSRLINPAEKKIIAYHEAGHAIVIQTIPEADPVQKVSIIARGMMGGFTMSLPLEDSLLESKKGMEADIISLLGGRAAEELIFNDITSGAANDIENATKLARKMVTRLGMSDTMGPMVYGQKEEMVFLGREISEQRDYSEAIAQKIDAEVQRIMSESFQRARDILTQNKDKLIEVAERLLEKETISREEFEEIYPAPYPKNQGIPAPLH